ncbi:hypothetical protein NliqN6_3409 [Naganishia liquefaciens]|uniref:BRCT domain-containing protein n=1 Tax=Naganishia liquefaciens TaxID=104408 RepID=A0A8H3TTR3_9TREE|nr:hypothetical protein NliqN6_3409 [Naganishia liquefaciens]
MSSSDSNARSSHKKMDGGRLPIDKPSRPRGGVQGTLDRMIKRSPTNPDTVSGSDHKRRKTSAEQPPREQYRSAGGKLGVQGQSVVTRHLLRTLDSPDNPITHSDIYDRTAHVVTCATDVRQDIQRAGAKFYISEKEYFASRQEKLKRQFRQGEKDDAHPVVQQDGCGGGSIGAAGQASAVISHGRLQSDGMLSTPKQIFSGLKIYVNGYTGPKITDLELKRLISVHGGEISLIDTSSVTHILVDKSLSSSKADKFLKSRNSGKGVRPKQVVHVDWVLDSSACERKLAERGYEVMKASNQASLAVERPTMKSSSRSCGVSRKVTTAAVSTEAGGDIIDLIDEDDSD